MNFWMDLWLILFLQPFDSFVQILLRLNDVIRPPEILVVESRDIVGKNGKVTEAVFAGNVT